MDIAQFINQAIELGSSSGIEALAPVGADIFLISELEVSCDMNGIDTFINIHGVERLRRCAMVYRSIGALELANAILNVANSNATDESMLDVANGLVTDRAGYDYEMLEKYVASMINTTNNN